jgi:predicted nuclease with TOPRIM domain
MTETTWQQLRHLIEWEVAVEVNCRQEAVIGACATRGEELEAECAALRDQLARLQTDYSATRQRCDELEAENAALTARDEPWSHTIRRVLQLQTQVATVTAERDAEMACRMHTERCANSLGAEVEAGEDRIVELTAEVEHAHAEAQLAIGLTGAEREKREQAEAQVAALTTALRPLADQEAVPGCTDYDAIIYARRALSAAPGKEGEVK